MPGAALGGVRMLFEIVDERKRNAGGSVLALRGNTKEEMLKLAFREANL